MEHHYFLQECGLFLRRELVRDRPPWSVRGGPELASLRQVVHLHHHAVDLEIDAVPVFEPLLAVLVDFLQAAQRLYVTADRETQLLQPVERLVVVPEPRPPTTSPSW